MNKELLEKNIKKNYKAVQNYLNGDTGAEGFLDSLSNLQTNFANYLIEVLKTKKYGKDDYKKSNIYQGHIKGSEEKYINKERLEHIISQKLLGKRVSINSLLDEGIKKLEELFNTQKSFEEALKCGKLQSIQLDKVILPPDDLPAPTTGSSKGFEKKELSQNKLWLFISTLRELGIYDDDLIFYSGKIDKNMMRESTYYAIFIPRINKTVFLNTGYGEATFICDGETSTEDMTTLGKEKLESELGAIKIKFSETDIEGWKNELNNALLGEGGKVGEKINTKEVKNNIKRTTELNKLKNFYAKHKNDTFTDSDGNVSTIEKLFSNRSYYEKNYKIINNIPSFKIKLLSNLRRYYNINWSQLQKELGVENKISSLNELKSFYTKLKNDTFIDSNGMSSNIEKLFSSYKYYKRNYKKINDNPSFHIKLPCDPAYYYDITWDEFQNLLKINKITTLENFKIFYAEHKNDTFIDSDGKSSTFENLFSSWDYYLKNYKKFLSAIKLPSYPQQFYNISWEKFQQQLGIDKNYHEITTLDELKSFYTKHKNDTFIDSDGISSTIKKLFSSLKYYKRNYSIINKNLQFNIKLPRHPNRIYNISWIEFQKELGIETEITTLDELKSFYDEHKNDCFIDSNGDTSTIQKLFSGLSYYKKNYKKINDNPFFHIKLPGNTEYSYDITWNELKSFLGVN